MSFLSKPLAAAASPERADPAALTTIPDAENCGVAFLAELQKALSPDTLQPDNLPVSEATPVEIANFPATPEILLKSEKSFKSREAFKTDETVEIPAVKSEEISAAEISETPLVTPQEMVEILLLNSPAQPQLPEKLRVENQTGDVSFKTLPFGEAHTFGFDSVPEKTPEADILKTSLLKNSKTATEISVAGIALQNVKTSPVLQAKKSETPAFKNDARVLEGAIVSLEVTLPKEKIPTEKEEKAFSFTTPEIEKEMPETGDFTEEKKSFKSDISAFKNEMPAEKITAENGEIPAQHETQSQKTAQVSETKTDAQFPNIVNSANPAFKTSAPQIVKTEVLHVPVMNFTETAVPAIQKLEKAEGGTMRLVLMPEALGQVKLEVVVENKIHAAITIQVENHEAKQQIEAQMPALKEQLVQSGMVIDKMNVEVKTDFKNLSQFAGFQQQPKQEERESRKKFVDSFKYLRETASEESGDIRQFIEQYI